MKKSRSHNTYFGIFDPPGQKHSRIARLQRFALLLVFSCPRPCCICHRQRKAASQLTAVQPSTHTAVALNQKKEPKKRSTTDVVLLFFGSPCRARTNDPAVNSRMLCQLS